MMPLLVLAIAFSGIAAYTDLRRGEIPNWLTTSAFGTGLVASAGLALHQGLGVRGALFALLGALCGGLACAVLPFVLWRKGVMGGGDLKLFVALGALCHTSLGIDLELSSFLTGTALVIVQLAYRGALFSMLKRAGIVVLNLALPKSKQRSLGETPTTWFRFAPAILLAALWITVTHGAMP